MVSLYISTVMFLSNAKIVYETSLIRPDWTQFWPPLMVRLHKLNPKRQNIFNLRGGLLRMKTSKKEDPAEKKERLRNEGRTGHGRRETRSASRHRWRKTSRKKKRRSLSFSSTISDTEDTKDLEKEDDQPLNRRKRKRRESESSSEEVKIEKQYTSKECRDRELSVNPNVDKKTIYVGNIPEEFRDHHLRELVKPYGEFHRAFIVKGAKAAAARWRYGFVIYKTLEGAQKAVDDLNSMLVNGRRLRVEQAFFNIRFDLGIPVPRSDDSEDDEISKALRKELPYSTTTNNKTTTFRYHEITPLNKRLNDNWLRNV
eukprot:CAMPEP_0167741692 /NCGR_PEP_ID=MMETSP0110_2-20121227/998_1 /TAXON_ID=629695 /ORGANISM="Gymnochlora sp., Strain CCMP2014" /LENGTH=313 /DNA_ID=CAMNT_0007625773 /DNA_START=112 /DNA_END=1053 /DNA_ORIENTATION=+